MVNKVAELEESLRSLSVSSQSSKGSFKPYVLPVFVCKSICLQSV
jgi:hypothetical protein